LADVPWYSIAEQIKLPKIFASQNLDLLHVPHFNVPIFYRGKFIVTIHDLNHHQFTQESATTRNFLIFKLKRFAYRYVIRHAIKNSQKILTPSKFVKNEIIKTFEIDPHRIAVTYEAAEEEYSKCQMSNVKCQMLLKKYKIKKPFIVYVGNAYPHKNLERLLEAFKILITHHSSLITKLLLVCPRDVFWQRLKEWIKEQGLEEQVFLTGYIPAAELSIILRSAQAYVFPSLSEGFGIPGLNSMAAGVPVIASDIPVLKEIYSNAALYFDPESPKDLASKINQVLSNEKTRSDLVKKGLEQVKKYSWLKMARETLKAYRFEL
jgi:glycosyltransferase involved in cell wall biosynthesis